MKIALIADDLTGANNSGVRLVKQGFAVATIMYGAPPVRGAYDAICVDTDSRYATANEARSRVMNAAIQLRGQGAQLVCKRIDTLLRGNVGAEIDGVLSASAPGTLAVVVAAFPEANRIVVDGHLLVDGEPVHTHAVAASDPIAPVRHSSIRTLLAEQSEAAVGTVGIQLVVQGVDAVANALSAAADTGNRVVVVDATSDAHIETLARAMARMDRPLIPVDPGPLSAAYARARFGCKGNGAGEKVIMCVGSTTALTREQLQHALASFGVEPICVRAELLAGSSKERGEEIAGAVAAALERLQHSAVCAVTTVQDAARVDPQTHAAAEGTTAQVIAKRIAQGLACIACDVITRSEGAIGGCYSSGGDVTAAFYREAGGAGFELIDEVMPLVSHVRLRAVTLDGLLMVTKGGSVGAASTATDCVRYLLSRLRARASEGVVTPAQRVGAELTRARRAESRRCGR